MCSEWIIDNLLTEDTVHSINALPHITPVIPYDAPSRSTTDSSYSSPIIARTGRPIDAPSFSPASNSNSSISFDYLLENHQQAVSPSAHGGTQIFQPSHKKIRPLLFNRGARTIKKSIVNEHRYWVRMDNKLDRRSHLQLLNAQLGKQPCSSISVCSSDSRDITMKEAQDTMGIFSENRAASKLVKETPSFDGYWAYFFPLSDIDSVWRTMVNAVTCHNKLEVFEIRVCRSNTYTPTNNNMMANYETFRQLKMQDDATREPRVSPDHFPVCVIVPCKSAKDIRSVGEALVACLRLQESIFYRSFSPKIVDDFCDGWKDEDEPAAEEEAHKPVMVHSKHDHLANGEYMLTREKKVMVITPDEININNNRRVGEKRPIWDCHTQESVHYESNLFRVEGVVWKRVQE